METLNLIKKSRHTTPHTEETKRKISLANTGKKGWNKGIPCTDEVKKKLSLKLKGKKYSNRKKPIPFTEEHKRKMGLYWKGRKRIPHVGWNKGGHLSEETKRKLSLANKGFKHSDEAKRKIGLASKGERNNFWKGGKMKEYSEYEQIRKSIEYKLWRDACFARDGYACVKDGKKGEIEAHHVCNFADYPELRTSIENGITLCVNCHKLFHKIYGKNFTTKEQLTEFINNKNI